MIAVDGPARGLDFLAPSLLSPAQKFVTNELAMNALMAVNDTIVQHEVSALPHVPKLRELLLGYVVAEAIGMPDP